MAAQGSQLTNKYAEGLSAQALLRRLRVRRHRRAAGDRPRQEALRCRICQRAAAFGCAGEPGGVLRHAQARRHDPRHVAAARRTPDAWLAGQHVRQVVPRRRLRSRSGDRADRLRRRRTARPGAQAEAHHRRGLRLLAGHRLGAFSRHCRCRRRLPDGRHGALRRSDCGRALSEPGRGRAFRDQHDAQDACAARAAGSFSPAPSTPS